MNGKAERSCRSNRMVVGPILLIALFICNPLTAQEKSSPGETIFKTKCVLCHGPDGAGQTPMGKQLQAANLGSKEVQKQSNAELHKIVHDGRANMPSFAEQLNEDEITHVLQYVRQFGRAAKKK